MPTQTFRGQAVIRYIKETTRGTFPTNPALLLFSKVTTSVKWFLDKDLKESLDVGNKDVEDHFSAKNIYGFTVRHELYDADKFEDFCVLDANGLPESYSVEIIPNQDAATKHYWRGTGWLPKSSKLIGKVGEAWIVETTFVGGKFSDPVTTDPGIGTGSREAKSAFTGSVYTWASGAITYEGAAIGILLEEFELECDLGTEAGYTTGGADPVADGFKPGVRRFKGTANFTLEDGAKLHWDRVKALTEGTTGFVIPFGTTGAEKITLTKVRWPKFEAEVTPEMQTLMANQPWVSRGVLAVGTV